MIIKWKNKGGYRVTWPEPEKYTRTDVSGWEEYYIGDGCYLEDNTGDADPVEYWIEGDYNHEDWYKPTYATKEEIKLFYRLRNINKLKDK